jgi:hypothetical protein
MRNVNLSSEKLFITPLTQNGNITEQFGPFHATQSFLELSYYFNTWEDWHFSPSSRKNAKTMENRSVWFQFSIETDVDFVPCSRDRQPRQRSGCVFQLTSFRK